MNRVYYTQNIKYQGQELVLPTEWFNSNGIKESIDGKNEILVSVPSNYMSLIKVIENLAINGGLVIPSEFQVNVANDAIFKHTPALPRLYIKLHHEAMFFDQNCRPLKLKDLAMGDFRAMIHVKGLYIGHHPSGKLASLQLRVIQLQNIPRIRPCMFAPVAASNLNDNRSWYNNPSMVANTLVPPQTPQPGAEPVTLTKKGRKPKLNRQNAISEAKIQQRQEQRKMDTLPSDFFNDLDLSALPTN